MKRYKCTICGMEVNENNYNFNAEAFVRKNEKSYILYCPFCGAIEKYLIDVKSFEIPEYEGLSDKVVTILDHAAKLEVFNSEFYKKASKLAENIYVKNVFKALSNIELTHAKIHVKYAGLAKLPVIRDMDYSQLKGDAILLKTAFDRERHAVEFYNKYINHIDSEYIKRIINALSEVEKEHIKLTSSSI